MLTKKVHHVGIRNSTNSIKNKVLKIGLDRVHINYDLQFKSRLESYLKMYEGISLSLYHSTISNYHKKQVFPTLEKIILGSVWGPP